MEVHPGSAFQQTMPTILCCVCGVQMPSNPSNMCVNCVRSQVDITENIPKQLTIHHCKICGRYLSPPNSWVKAELESRELLTFCLKRVRGLNKVKLVDAGFIWTEAHSKRLKLKLTIQKEVYTATILQQTFIIEYIVHYQQCDQCTKLQSEHTWVAVVQLRQNVNHKRTFYFLEQLILKHNAQSHCTNIKEMGNGIDFFFNHRSHSLKFIDFLQQMVPIRYSKSEQLISSDASSNTYNYKYTFSVEIAPICRDDLLCLPTRFAHAHGNISPLAVCSKISNMIHIMDPNTLQTGQIVAAEYWKAPFRSLASARQLIEFVVLDVVSQMASVGKWQLAEVQVARAADLGSNDVTFFTRTHLGHVLRPGDSVLGYQVSTGNFNDDDLKPLASYRGPQIPDIVLVRKIYPGEAKKRGAAHRAWRVKNLAKTEDLKPHEADRARQDYQDFLDDLEADPEARAKINLYRDPKAFRLIQQQKERREARDSRMDIDQGEPAQPMVAAIPPAEDDEENPDAVRLEELLEDLSLNDPDEMGDEAEDIEEDDM